MSVKISELPIAAANTADDLLVAVQSAATVKETFGAARDWFRAQTMWRTIETSRYTVAPMSVYRLAMSDTSDMPVGLPVRYTITGSGTYRYGIVTAVATNTSIDVAGASLSGNLTGLWVGAVSSVVVEYVSIGGNYESATSNTAIYTYGHTFRTWKYPAAQLVSFTATHGTADSGAAQPYVNVLIQGSATAGDSGGAGVLMQTAGTKVTNATGGLDADHSTVTFGDVIELLVTKGANGNAQNLTVAMIFVLE